MNSCKKGKAGERECAHKWNEVLGTSCRRGQQHSGLEGQDVVGIDGIHNECKRVEKLNIDVAMAQSIRDEAERRLRTGCPPAVPIVSHRKNRKDWLVTVRIDDVVEFAQAILQNYRG